MTPNRPTGTTNWGFRMSSQEYEDWKKQEEMLRILMKSPRIQSMIHKVNSLGEEVKQLKEKCKQLEQLNKDK